MILSATSYNFSSRAKIKVGTFADQAPIVTLQANDYQIIFGSQQDVDRAIELFKSAKKEFEKLEVQDGSA